MIVKYYNHCKLKGPYLQLFFVLDIVYNLRIAVLICCVLFSHIPGFLADPESYTAHSWGEDRGNLCWEVVSVLSIKHQLLNMYSLEDMVLLL